MRKRILSVLLVLAMVLSFVPAVVTAAPVETVVSPYAGTHATTGHTCEHEGCGTTVWTAWPTDGTIPTAGHYYLTKNVQLTGQLGLSNKKLHICLNGFVMTAKANTRIGWLYGTTELVITDCTAHTENGIYYAGAMTGGVDKVSSTGGGGAFYVYKGSLLEMHDGKITNCSSITGGGALYNNGTIKLLGGELSGNVAASGTATKHGGAIFNNSGGVLAAENMRFTNNNADYGEGGVLQNWGAASFKNCTFTGNNAATGGALSLGGDNKTVLVDGCRFTGNTAGVVSAINAKITTGSITIKDTTITGNRNKNGFGVLNVQSSAKPVALQGKMVITDNLTTGDKPNNLHVQDGATEGIDATGLTEGSLIGVHLRGTRRTFSTASNANNKDYFRSDVEGYVIETNGENRLTLTVYVAPEHPHCVCGKTDCTDTTHAALEYQKLTDPAQLAAGGAFYLDNDVVLPKNVGIQNGTVLTICLNGHDLTTQATNVPMFWTYNEATINICDCTAHREAEGFYRGGAIRDFQNQSTTGGTFFLRDKAVMNFYGGQILNCTDKKGGGAIRVEKGAVLNFFDGHIAGCSSEVAGGAIYNSGSTNIYGGEFAENSAKLGKEPKDGGAIFNNSTGMLLVENAAFLNNHADFGNGGAIRSWGNATIKHCTFTGNHAQTAGAIAPAGADKIFTIEGCSFTENTAELVSVISVASGVKVTIKDTTITGNRNEKGFGAVNVVGGATPIKLEGKVIITGNTASEVTNNLHVQNGDTDGYDVSGLNEGSAIGISLQNSRIDKEMTHFTTAFEGNNKAFFTSDDANYSVELNGNNKLYLQYNYTHIHCVCGKTDCTAEGEAHYEIKCKPWTDATMLPARGGYYLATDVTVSAQTRVEASELQLCLNGHSVTIGEQGNRAYYLNDGGKLTVTDCAGSGKFTGGTLGVILSNSAGKDMELNLYAGTFTDNHAMTTGGALIIQGGCTFHMYGGYITGNTATTSQKEDKTYVYCNAGGVYVGSGAVFYMHGGEITNNKAKALDGKGGMGGGLQVAYGATAYLRGGRIFGNEAYNGGGIFVTGEGTVLNLQGTEISGNTANNGAGILSQTGAVINLSAGKLCSNKSTANGGGLYASINTAFVMTGGEISGNEGAYGAGVYVLSADATFSGGAVSGNKASKGSGGIHITVAESRNRPSKVEVKEDALITGNTAAQTGGGISASGTGTRLIIAGGIISKNSAKSGGGLISQSGATVELSGGKITGNTASATGAGGYISTNSKLIMTGGSVFGNTAKGHGGGFYAYRANTQFYGGSISGNTSDGGAGLKITGGTIAIGGLTVSGNRAMGKYQYNATTGENKLVRGNGGGLYISTAGYKENGVYKEDVPRATITNIYLSGNYANGPAGGLVLVSAGSSLKMTGGTVIGNESGSDGGGMYISNNTKAEISNVTFTGNISASNGGAVFCRDSLVNMRDITFTGNKANSTGAVVATGKTVHLTIQTSVFTENEATASCGAAMVKGYGRMDVTDCSFHKNTAGTDCGAVYFSNPGYGSIVNTEIYENTALKDAGGVYIGQNSIVAMENVTVRDNTAQGDGGGVLNMGRLEMQDVKILNNTSGGNGGGLGGGNKGSILLAKDIGVYAENCVITGNKAGQQGSGVFAPRLCPLQLKNTVITENTAGAEGGGIHSEGRIGLENVTVTGNTSGGLGYAVYLMPTTFDGHSYHSGQAYMGGEMIVKDNDGGDLYLDEGTILAVTGETLGEKAHVNITLSSGVVCQRVQGVYDYVGGNLVYTLTAGDRSVTDPEDFGPNPPSEETSATEHTAKNNTWLYVGIGVFALAAAAVVLLILKKKKTPTGEAK